MSFATTTGTRSVTSVASGTAVTGGNRARFTHASTTAFTVGSLVVNTGFSAAGYNEGGRVVVSAASIGFTYDYDANVQRGAGSSGDDAPVTVVAGNKGVAKPVVATGTISRSKGISVSLVAEQDRAYTD